MTENVIDVHIIQNTPFIWNAKDVQALRETHRIVGKLVGSLPRNPHQNVQLGLPLQLMPEETSLLLEKGFVRLVDYPILKASRSPSIVDKLNQQRTKACEEQVVLLKEERKKQIIEMADTILEGKQNKFHKRKGKKSHKNVENPVIEEATVNSDSSVEIMECFSDVQPKTKRKKQIDKRRTEIEENDVIVVQEDIGVKSTGASNLDRDSVIAEEIGKIRDTPLSNTYVQLFTGCPWIGPADAVPVQWDFPSSPFEQLRYKVFSDLWHKGYYITSGLKFGGDFLVYPGDPLKYHAFHIAICSLPNEMLGLRTLVAHGRVGTMVRKTVLLCSLNLQGNVDYITVQWANDV